MGNALLPQNIIQGDLVQGAADLHKDGGDGHNGDAAHKRLLLFSGHGVPLLIF